MMNLGRCRFVKSNTGAVRSCKFCWILCLCLKLCLWLVQTVVKTILEHELREEYET